MSRGSECGRSRQKKEAGGAGTILVVVLVAILAPDLRNLGRLIDDRLQVEG